MRHRCRYRAARVRRAPRPCGRLHPLPCLHCRLRSRPTCLRSRRSNKVVRHSVAASEKLRRGAGYFPGPRTASVGFLLTGSRRGSPMKAKTLTLHGALAVSQSGAPGQPLPVPSQGPPASVAGVGPIAPGTMPVMQAPLPAPRPDLSALMQPGMGEPIPAPLVATKFIVPKDVRVTAFPGTAMSRMYDTPSVFGLRPGYIYRFELNNLPYYPGKSLYPEIELRGTLVPRPGMKYMDYPIPVVLSEEDIEKVMKGAVITKVIYLEDPDKALPAEVRPDAPVAMPDGTEQAAIKAAINHGRLMAIVRVGNLKPTVEQLRPYAIDGTVLLPGEKYLKAPVVPPIIPFFACPFYDPILGPKGPKEECFVDGDDKGDPLGIGPFGRLGGLNPTDVGVEYTINGQRRVTTSNLVCICSPRFMIRRVDILPTGFDHRQSLAGNVGLVGTGFFRERAAAMVDIALTRPGGVQGNVRPSAYIGKVGLAFFLGSNRPLVVGQVDGVKVTGALVEPEQLTAFPTLCPLTVTKTVDPAGPTAPGEVRTITIKYANTGSKPVSDLVVSDSLSARLEYVPGSAQSDRPANFTAAENEVGSVIVRWELPGVILPGQSGTVKFKAKVR